MNIMMRNTVNNRSIKIYNLLVLTYYQATRVVETAAIKHLKLLNQKRARAAKDGDDNNKYYLI